MRLNAFFVKPAAPSPGGDITPQTECNNPMNGRRGSVGSAEGMETSARSRSSSASPRKNTQSDYELLFPPFFLQSHTTLAPYNRFNGRWEDLDSTRLKIDVDLQRGWNGIEELRSRRKRLRDYAVEQLRIPPHKRTRQVRRQPTVREVMGMIHGTENDPIDLTDPEARRRMHNAAALLKKISIKHLKFAEDVRPPYRGTYTKLPSRKTPTSLARNPFERAFPQVNYDYDSEAEWEEPGEGEDLDSEGEEENGSDDEEDEMDGFLDDEDTGEGLPGAGNRRRHIVGDLEPVCSGLLWEDANGICQEGNPESKISLKGYRLEVLLGRCSRICCMIK